MDTFFLFFANEERRRVISLCYHLSTAERTQEWAFFDLLLLPAHVKERLTSREWKEQSDQTDRQSTCDVLECRRAREETETNFAAWVTERMRMRERERILFCSATRRASRWRPTSSRASSLDWRVIGEEGTKVVVVRVVRVIETNSSRWKWTLADEESMICDEDLGEMLEAEWTLREQMNDVQNSTHVLFAANPSGKKSTRLSYSHCFATRLDVCFEQGNDWTGRWRI